MKVGDLVRSNTGTKHHGALGIVVDTRPRWLEPRENELLVTIRYPDGNEVGWGEYQLEVVSESR